jgi:hypothetical protein
VWVGGLVDGCAWMVMSFELERGRVYLSVSSEFRTMVKDVVEGRTFWRVVGVCQYRCGIVGFGFKTNLVVRAAYLVWIRVTC